MLRAGDKIENARSGQRKTFLVTAEDSGGELLRMEEHNPPGPFEPVHIHPEQMSTAEVLSGSLLFVVGGREIRLGPGSRLEIPPGTAHTFPERGSTGGALDRRVPAGPPHRRVLRDAVHPGPAGGAERGRDAVTPAARAFCARIRTGDPAGLPSVAGPAARAGAARASGSPPRSATRLRLEPAGTGCGRCAPL